MKKIIFGIALMVGIATANAQTAAQKEVAAEARVESVRVELEAAEHNLDIVYQDYMKATRAEIKENDKKIEELRAKMVKPRRSPLNDDVKKKIDDLENRNVDLRARLYAR